MRHEILCSDIPMGGFGRELTSHELKLLRAAGCSLSSSSIVVRDYDSPNMGSIYEPAKGGGFNRSGISVQRRG
jgi:hypothetical protein